jgi:hypothetical protein
MPSSGMLHSVALIGTDVSEKCSSSIVTVTRIGELRITLAVTSNRHTPTGKVPSSQILVTLMMEALPSSETSVVARTTRRDIQEDGILLVIEVG